MSMKEEIKKVKNGFRPGMDKALLERVNKLELSPAKVLELEKQQEFDSIKVTSYRAKVFLMNDSLRRIRDKAFITIDQGIYNIKKMRLAINRLEIELASGDIKTEIRDGVTMTKDELTLHIDLQKKMTFANFKDLVVPLSELAGVVGHKDIARNNVYAQPHFDKYVIGLESELKLIGYNLFEL